MNINQQIDLLWEAREKDRKEKEINEKEIYTLKKELKTLKEKVKSKWFLLDIFEAFYNNLEYIEKGDIN